MCISSLYLCFSTTDANNSSNGTLVAGDGYINYPQANYYILIHVDAPDLYFPSCRSSYIPAYMLQSVVKRAVKGQSLQPKEVIVG